MSLKSKIIAYTEGSGLFYFLVGAVVLVALSYLFAVNRTIVLVAERNSLESRISASKSDITELESSYIAQKGAITMDLAQSLGYGEAAKTMYMQKKAVSLLTRAETIQ